MKVYIFFTADIHPIGGMQLYVANKANYLERNGWRVIVFYNNNIPIKQCKNTYMNRYIKYGLSFLDIQPAHLSVSLLEKALNKIFELLEDVDESDEILIESNSDVNSLWAELLAKRLHAKHLCFICNEKFRGNEKYYEENIDFFKFKYEREELLGINKNSLKNLFADYLNIEENDKCVFFACEGEPVQNIDNEMIKKIKRKDYNIAYLGRLEKGYVPNIIEGVKNFAKTHCDKTIEFIIIGDYELKRKDIERELKDAKNVDILFTGSLVPIPRLIYSKVDVVIAGSGCALISAKEGVPTIVADSGNYLANGILGYTVQNIFNADIPESQTDFDEALEDVLIKKIHKNMKYEFSKYDDSPDIVYEGHFKFFKNSIQKSDYYDVLNKQTKLKGVKKFKAIIKIEFPEIYYFLKIIKYELKFKFIH